MPLVAVNSLISNQPQAIYLSASGRANFASPFLVGEPIYVDSLAGTTLYGADTAGDLSATKHASFKQTISGNKAFAASTAINTPQNTTGGALSDANQLRVVVVSEGVFVPRARGDQVAAAGTAIVAAGGGTAAGQSGLITDGTNSAGATALVFKRGDAGTQTVLVGDKINVAGDTTDYYATATTTSLNGTTGVSFAITPPLQTSPAAGTAVTVTAANGKVFMFGTAPAVGAKVEVDILDAADVVTVGNTSGALTAGRLYDAVCRNFFWTAGNVNVSKAVAH